MALRWYVTEFLTGLIVGETTVRDPSVTIGLDGERGTADIWLGHMITPDGGLNLARAKTVAGWGEPAGKFCLALIDVEENAQWGGQYDRVLGEWQIRGTAPSSSSVAVPVELGGLLAYAGDRLLEEDYRESGPASWIASDLLSAAFVDVAVDIGKPTTGAGIPVDWRAGRITYLQALEDVQRATGLEVAVRTELELKNGAPYRIKRWLFFGTPLQVLNPWRAIDASGGNGITVTRPTSLDLWASSVNVYGAGHGDDQYAGNATRARPQGMPTVTRGYAAPDVQSPVLAAAMAKSRLDSLTGIAPLQVDVLRENWTNKFPRLGDAHRVIVDPCLAFPWGIDALYRITRITYQPKDAAPETLRLVMEEEAK